MVFMPELLNSRFSEVVKYFEAIYSPQLFYRSSKIGWGVVKNKYKTISDTKLLISDTKMTISDTKGFA